MKKEDVNNSLKSSAPAPPAPLPTYSAKAQLARQAAPQVKAATQSANVQKPKNILQRMLNRNG